MEWSITQIAKLAGTTSRTLRHYGDLGLLHPTSTGTNGYRYYDEDALVRLQRILLLRDLGLGLPQIAEVLARGVAEETALRDHLAWLRQEQDRLARRIASVEKTIAARQGGEELMAQEMFDGFDHTAYEAEVTERWGADAYRSGDVWWRGLSDADKAAFQARVAELAADWRAAAESGVAPDGAQAQALAERHVAWLRSTPGVPKDDFGAYITGLGEMYVADERFGRNYAIAAGGTAGAEFVRDALRVYAETRL